MEQSWTVIATQLPLAALFGVFAIVIITMFMSFIKEQRREFTTALETLTKEMGDKMESMSGKLDEIETAVKSKRRL